MGRVFVVELEGRSYRCKFCRTHLALPDDLVSRDLYTNFDFVFEDVSLDFAFLQLYNITMGTLEERMMLSGMHTVADIFCCCCGQIESALEKSQKYKEGKFVLERGRIVDEIDYSTEVFIDTRSSMSDDGEE
ncbi:hypothetical protein ACFE04_023255 [Oxalis oulophora]